MPVVHAEVLLVVPSYLAGTFPSAQVVARREGHDPTAEGSGNPGASNVYRVAGRRAGALVLAADLLKGAVPTAVGLVVGGRALGFACGAAAVLGHVLPVTRRFRGGKGVATAAGIAVVLFPVVSAVLALVWVAVARAAGKASVASLVTAIAAVPALVIARRPAWEVAAMAAVVAVVVARHAGNIRRLVRREERSLREKAS